MQFPRGRRGFTIVEVVIVVVIIGILASISIPMFNAHVRRSMLPEGRALVAAIVAAEKMYLSDHQTYLPVSLTTANTSLNINTMNNACFKQWSVTPTAAGFTATTIGSGDATGITIRCDYVTNNGTTPIITVTGL